MMAWYKVVAVKKEKALFWRFRSYDNIKRRKDYRMTYRLWA